MLDRALTEEGGRAQGLKSCPPQPGRGAGQRPGAPRFGRVRPRAIYATLPLLLFGCRVYRDQGPATERLGAPSAQVAPTPRVGLEDSRAQGPSAQGGGKGEDPLTLSSSQAAPQPAEALSLWVLNRSKTDLIASTPVPTENRAVDAIVPTSALVVLGLGAPHVCAEPFAQRALHYAKTVTEPAAAVGRLLDDIRHWRWPDVSAGTLQVSVRGSDGTFGAVQSAEPSGFSHALLEAAVQRHAVIDGKSPRWRKALAVPPSNPDVTGSVCEASPGPELVGPVGVLLRTGEQRVTAGLINQDAPSDAGVISIVTQYGLSVAAGPRGGVVMITTCPTVPTEAAAEIIYAGIDRDVQLQPSGAIGNCPIGYAIMDAQRPRVAGDPLAWASVDSSDSVPAELGVSGTFSAGRDAGAPPSEKAAPP